MGFLLSLVIVLVPKVAVLSCKHEATIFPVMFLNWKIIYFFRVLVVNSVICSTGWPKPGFQFVLLNKTYCWHVLMFHLTKELSENRSRTKSQYYFSCFLASKHLRTQTQSELQTVQHISNCLCDVLQLMLVANEATGFLWPLGLQLSKDRNHKVNNLDFLFLSEAQEGDRAPSFKMLLFPPYCYYVSLEISLLNLQKVKTCPTWSKF